MAKIKHQTAASIRELGRALAGGLPPEFQQNELMALERAAASARAALEAAEKAGWLTAESLALERKIAEIIKKSSEALESSASTDEPRPPVSASKLLYLLMPADDRDHVIGDLDETYLKLADKFDERYARRWYWTQAIRTMTLYPLRTAANYLRHIIIGVVSNLLGP